MNWKHVREKYPNIWVLFEAIEAESIAGERILVNMSVLIDFKSSEQAMTAYRKEHKQNPSRELYVYHTQNEQLHIKERVWMGVTSL